MDAASSSSSERIAVICNELLVKYLGAVERNFETNEEYVAFYNVPYAKTPTGLKRYQAPEPWEPEKLIYDVSEKRQAPGIQVLGRRVYGSADCLQLNIFLPKRPELIEGLVPVLVFFHGGGYSLGSNFPTYCTPDSIIQHEVMFITVSYRLATHGFYNHHTEACPGNAGLKDQVRALEWIRDHIRSFKGDPNNVTISGCGTGGTCVNLHLVAPMSKGLFHKAIVQSGGVYCPWGYQGYRRNTKDLISNDEECRELLFNVEDTGRLHERVWELLMADNLIRHPFSTCPPLGPTTETIEEGAFMARKIDEMMQAEVDPKISILAGITLNEGLKMLSADRSRDYGIFLCDEKRFLRLMVDSFHWDPSMATEDNKDQLKRQYCRHKNVDHMTPIERRRRVAELLHDICYRRFYDNFKFGPERTLHKKFFVYQFEYFSELSLVRRENLESTLPEIATQTDELCYLYRNQDLRERNQNDIAAGQMEHNPEIDIVTKHMCSLWANFCKKGEPKSDFAPDVKWIPHTEERPCYLRIGANLLLHEGRLCEDDWKWLNSFVEGKPVVEQ